MVRGVERCGLLWYLFSRSSSLSLVLSLFCEKKYLHALIYVRVPRWVCVCSTVLRWWCGGAWSSSSSIHFIPHCTHIHHLLSITQRPFLLRFSFSFNFPLVFVLKSSCDGVTGILIWWLIQNLNSSFDTSKNKGENEALSFSEENFNWFGMTWRISWLIKFKQPTSKSMSSVWREKRFFF